MFIDHRQPDPSRSVQERNVYSSPSTRSFALRQERNVSLLNGATNTFKVTFYRHRAPDGAHPTPRVGAWNLFGVPPSGGLLNTRRAIASFLCQPFRCIVNTLN